MTLTIELSPDEEAKLRARAAAAQKDVRALARDAILHMIDTPSLSEILAPVHDATRRSGMTEAEVDELIDRARDEYRTGRRDGQP